MSSVLRVINVHVINWTGCIYNRICNQYVVNFKVTYACHMGAVHKIFSAALLHNVDIGSWLTGWMWIFCTVCTEVVILGSARFFNLYRNSYSKMVWNLNWFLYFQCSVCANTCFYVKPNSIWKLIWSHFQKCFYALYAEIYFT